MCKVVDLFCLQFAITLFVKLAILLQSVIGHKKNLSLSSRWGEEVCLGRSGLQRKPENQVSFL